MNNLYDFYASRCEKWKDKKLFDNSITYSESLVMAKRRAAFLQRQNFKKGNVIGILGANSWEWCVTYMAITSAGMGCQAAIEVERWLCDSGLQTFCHTEGGGK